MNVHSAASDHQDIPQQERSIHLDPEGTILDWLEREAALEASIAHSKRKRSDSSTSTSTSTTSAFDHRPEPFQPLDPAEEILHTQMATSPVAGTVTGPDAQVTTSDPFTNDPSLASTPSAPNITPLQQALVKIPSDPQWVAARLKSYRLFQGDREALKRYPKFQEQLKRIINQKRLSSIDPEDITDFQREWDEYKDKNEDTVLNELLPYFIKKKRTISIQGTDEEKDAHAVVSFSQSGVVAISNREFQRTCVPLREDGSPLEKKILDAMAKEDGMTNPKPDRTFGISLRKDLFPIGFTPPPEIAVWLEVMRGIHHPFFLIEGKSYQGSLLDAQNQACRGGATLVSAARRLLATLNQPDIVGPDTRTFVFSATLSPGLMDIWVNWAEVPSPGALPNYHMNQLMSKAIADEEQFGQLRKTLHNILDWGCGPRFNELEPLYPDIMDYANR
ncbi:MAG: hypothetical protein Q9171_004723 [Xanthocarpia ochracea]